MENYAETNVSATTWKRANRIEILNGYGTVPVINITEEMIVSIGGLTVNNYVGVLSTNYSPTGEINLYNPIDGSIIGTISHNEIMTILYSIYRDAADKRDNQAQ